MVIESVRDTGILRESYENLTSLDFLLPGMDWTPPSEAFRMKLYTYNRK